MVWPFSRKRRSRFSFLSTRRRDPSPSTTTSTHDNAVSSPLPQVSSPGFPPRSERCPACEDLSVDDSPSSTRVINTKFKTIDSRARAGCDSCGMIHRACLKLGIAKPLLGWRTVWRDDMRGDSESAYLARGEEGIPRNYTKETYIGERDLDVEIHINSPYGTSKSEYQVLVILLGTPELGLRVIPRSQPIELYRPIGTSAAASRSLSERAIISQRRWPAIGAAHSVPRMSFDPACTVRVQEWLRNCLENHPECKQGTEVPVLPARVLDVSGWHVRLVETNGLKAEYATLSYCWGPPTSHRLVTLRGNLAGHLQGIQWKTLSKTHQDAITMTRRLGLSYLWIDALCIIQDSPEDWANTAARMADIYENSLLTICATWSPHSDGGLFSDRHAARRGTKGSKNAKPLRVHSNPSIDARVAFTPHFWENGLQDMQELGVVPDPVFDPLLTRAWCMQERLLSPRILEFTLEEIQWECKRERRCECQEADRRITKTRRMQFAQLAAGMGGPSQPGQDDADAWLNIVSTYSGMAITYPKDRLPALSGLAHHFYPLKGDLANQRGYLAGIWQQDILPSLLWYITPHLSIGPDGKPRPMHTPHDTYQAPSWSWASREGHSMFTKFEPDKELQIIDASCTYATDICGQSTGGSLTVRGRLAPVTLRYGKGGYEGKETAFIQKWQKTYWVKKDDLSTYIKADTEIGVKGHADYLPPDSPVFCLRVGWETLEEYPQPKASCGLVLRYVPATNQYVRIAKFTKHDDQHKLRYMRRRKPDGSGFEDVVQYDDFFDGLGQTTIEII